MRDLPRSTIVGAPRRPATAAPIPAHTWVAGGGRRSSPGQSLSRTVRITSHDANFKLTNPKVSIQGRDTAEWEFAKYFTPTVREVPGENAVDIEVTLTGMPETLSGSFSGMLVVNTGHPERDEIKALISGVCRGGTTSGTPTPAPVPTPLPMPGTTPPK